ncbi:MAG: trypsin-like peptidase domain-containing protein, partial [Microcoleus sp. PH2017_40_RAT_O_B]|uniref:S1 family peptidase n=1 Tax=Microcoleus sp. PH2017_40_RAT_O_B TaxID=2798850 RepID=UPI001D331879
MGNVVSCGRGFTRKNARELIPRPTADLTRLLTPTGNMKYEPAKPVNWWDFIPMLLLLTATLNTLSRPTPEHFLAPSPAIFQQVNQQVSEIANLVTVRIISDSVSGSGVIIQHQNQTYTILTNNHVVADNQDKTYQVLTADGQTHIAKWLRSSQFGKVDLALVQFTTSQSYRVA